MTGVLKGMAACERARRDGGKYPILSFIVSDEAGAMTDVEQAATAIIAAADVRTLPAGIIVPTFLQRSPPSLLT